jgi:Domain of unknown function (DUF4397)
MKTYKNISKRLIATLCAVCLLSVLLSSCLKQNNNQNYSPPVAAVTFIQASPNEPPLDLYFDNDRVNFYPINYGGDIDYFRAYTGKRNVNIFNSATMNKILSDTIHLNQNTDYSLFLANTPNKPEILLLTDSLTKPAAGKANVRFVNLSPDTPPVSLAIQGSQVLVTNEPYKGFTPFMPVTANTTYTFEVRQGTTATVLATLSNITLNSNYVYTIWFHGLTNSTSTADKLSVDIMTNTYYY